jgi:hypothetical protein
MRSRRAAASSLLAIALLTASAVPAHALENVTAKKMQITDTDPSKRKVQFQSSDTQISQAEAAAADSEGASLHVFSATDDQCFSVGASDCELSSSGKLKCKSAAGKIQVRDGSAKAQFKVGVTYSLNEPTQGTVTMILRVGSAQTWCAVCDGTGTDEIKKDEPEKYVVKSCDAVPCPPEPTACGVTSTTSTTLPNALPNVLQVFEETDPSSRPLPSCQDVATWILDASLNLSLGSYHLESADIDSPSVSDTDIRSALFNGSLISFELVSEIGRTLCSFVATWDVPMGSQWVVETPSLSPIDDTAVSPNPCDNGWEGNVSTCAAAALAELIAAEPDIPPQDLGDDPHPPDPNQPDAP